MGRWQVWAGWGGEPMGRPPLRGFVDGWVCVDTKFLKHEIRVMLKNVTVTLDEDTARWVRVEAAKQDMSVSQYLREMLSDHRSRSAGYDASHRLFMAREPRPLRACGDLLPTRQEVHERAGPGAAPTGRRKAGG